MSGTAYLDDYANVALGLMELHGATGELRWLLEELRVQVFAPELKTAVPVSPQRVQDAFARLGIGFAR